MSIHHESSSKILSHNDGAAHFIWTENDVALATHGVLSRGSKLQDAVASSSLWRATGLCIDTRQVKKGDLFIALLGEINPDGTQNDGHKYIAKAFDGGAIAAMVNRSWFDAGHAQPYEGKYFIIVDDTLTGLQDMGRYRRENFGGLSIGITGSVGKTGTKEMLAACFAAFAPTHAARASFNNHIGLPLTVSAIPDGCDVAVFEMGMNHAGEISPLSQIAKPDIAIITTVADVHIEFFDSIEGIADAKAEIFDGMSAQGTAILNGDNPHFARLKAAAKTQGLQHVYSFGQADHADARLIGVIEAANGMRVHANIMGRDVHFTMQHSGHHQALNALSVLLAVHVAGYDIDVAMKALGTIAPLAGRGQRQSLNYGDPKNPVTLIDESYNASPVAMKAAFKVLAMIDPGRGGRRIAILGDMLELGDKSAQYHRDLALPLQSADIDFVYTCGSMMKNLHDALPQDIGKMHKDTSLELAEIVPEAIMPGDVVMVKGSLGSKMNVVVEALRHRGGM